MHAGLLVAILVLFANVETKKAAEQETRVLKQEALVAAIPPYKPSKTMGPHARDACSKYDCAEDHKNYQKTMTKEYYELYIKCLNKCEPEMSERFILNLIRDGLEAQQMLSKAARK